MMLDVVFANPFATGGLLLVTMLAVGVGMAATSRGGDDDGPLPDGARVEETHDAENASVVELDPPDIQTARWGGLQKLWRMRSHIKKRRMLANKGYVQWMLIDDTYPKPKYIQPEYNGGGIPEYKYDGSRYLFPKEAMVASEEQGLWTVVHKKGEADPVNLRAPDEFAIPADSLENYLDMRVNTEPPSWWDQFDMDISDIFQYGIVGFILLMLFRSAFSGGMPI